MADALTGCVAIVTGAARGLGRAMALGLAAHGARVVATDLPDQAELASLEGEGNGRIAALGADATKENDCARAVNLAAQRFGGVSVLVNNAGVGMQFINPRFGSKPTRFWELTPAQWREVFEINAASQFLMARAAVPSLIERSWGRVINVTTSYATMLLPGFTPYGPSKSACEASTVIWSKDLVGTGVTCNALLPGGAADTRMITDDGIFPDRSQLVQPAQMVPPLVWLASQQSDGVSGQRFVAKEWNPAAPAQSGRPAAWPAN